MKKIASFVALALLAGGLTLGVTTPADGAVRPCENLDTPQVVELALCYPHDPGSTFVLEAPLNVWGLRDQARFVDQRVDGLRLLYAPGLECVDYPAAVCIHVVKTLLDNDDRGAEFDWGTGTLRLNTRFAQMPLAGYRRRAAGHELLHALGFMHHSGPGLVSGGAVWVQSAWPTPRELAALRAWYDRPAAAVPSNPPA